jgi:hypothetical protein
MEGGPLTVQTTPVSGVWLRGEEEKINYVKSRLQGLTCNATARDFPASIIFANPEVRKLGEGGYATVFAACEDEICQYGYAVKRVDRELHLEQSGRYSDLDNLYATINKLIETNKTAHLTYVYAVLHCPLDRPERFVPPREQWRQGQKDYYRQIREQSMQFGAPLPDQAIEEQIFHEIAGYTYVLSEKGGSNVRTWLQATQTTVQQELTLFLQLWQGQDALLGVDYEHLDPKSENAVIFPIDSNGFFAYQILGVSYYVPTLGMRAAWIDYEDVRPIRRNPGFVMDVPGYLESTANGLISVLSEWASPNELIGQLFQQSLDYLLRPPAEYTFQYVADVPVVKQLSQMFTTYPTGLTLLGAYGDPILPPAPQTPPIQPFTPALIPSPTPIVRPLQPFTPMIMPLPTPSPMIRPLQPFTPMLIPSPIVRPLQPPVLPVTQPVQPVQPVQPTFQPTPQPATDPSRRFIPQMVMTARSPSRNKPAYRLEQVQPSPAGKFIPPQLYHFK